MQSQTMREWMDANHRSVSYWQNAGKTVKSWGDYCWKNCITPIGNGVDSGNRQLVYRALAQDGKELARFESFDNEAQHVLVLHPTFHSDQFKQAHGQPTHPEKGQSGWTAEFVKRPEFAADLVQVGGTHYKDMAIQPWAVMEIMLTHEEFVGFLKGNYLKYAMRAGHKGEASEDLKKAEHYAQKLREVQAK